MGVVSSHVEYRLTSDSGEQTPDYNLPASEREITLRYVGNKTKIRVVKDEFPNYMFKEDFNTLNQLRTLSPSQVIEVCYVILVILIDKPTCPVLCL